MYLIACYAVVNSIPLLYFPRCLNWVAKYNENKELGANEYLRIENYNIFHLRYDQHIFDLLHLDERLCEHMLNNICLLNEEIIDILIDFINDKSEQYTRINLKKKEINDDEYEMGNTTKNFYGFKMIDASYIPIILKLSSQFLHYLKDKYYELIYNENNVNNNDQLDNNNYILNTQIINYFNSTQDESDNYVFDDISESSGN
ncbi:hypothetical protein ABK040_008347 [Willaertia magna]